MTTIIHITQILINAPLQTIFDYITNLTKHPEWNNGKLKIETIGSSPITIGKEYLSKDEITIQKNRPNQLQITKYEPPRKFGFTAKNPDFGKVFHVFTFNEQ